jgi:hypothetical protein
VSTPEAWRDAGETDPVKIVAFIDAFIDAQIADEEKLYARLNLGSGTHGARGAIRGSVAALKMMRLYITGEGA